MGGWLVDGLVGWFVDGCLMGFCVDRWLICWLGG